VLWQLRVHAQKLSLVQSESFCIKAPFVLDVRFCCGRTRAACLTKKHADMDFYSIISDVLRFLRIGFLVRNDLLFERLFASFEVLAEIL
jgi:hypothetical protein